MNAAERTTDELLQRYHDVDSAMRGLAAGGGEIPTDLAEERTSLLATLNAAGVDPNAPADDTFGTLDDDDEPVVSVLPVNVPSQQG